MIIHPNAMLAIFGKTTHDVVIDVLRRYFTLHEMLGCHTVDHVQAMPESPYPTSAFAIFKAANEIGAVYVWRKWSERPFIQIEDENPIGSGKTHIAVFSVIYAVTGHAYAQVVEPIEDKTLHIGTMETHTLGVKAQEQTAIEIGYCFDIICDIFPIRGREGVL